LGKFERTSELARETIGGVKKIRLASSHYLGFAAMLKLLFALCLVASASASCAKCKVACDAATGADCSVEAIGCAYESTANCGCSSCDSSVDTYRVGCGLAVCSRRLTETTDLEESAAKELIEQAGDQYVHYQEAFKS
jgi:hypothetical protein